MFKKVPHQFSILLVVLLSTQTTSRRRPLRQNPCIGSPNESFISNPRGCKYFFFCQNGKAIEAHCPGGMWFNPRLSICDHPRNVDCNFDNPTTTTTTTTEMPTTTTTTTITTTTRVTTTTTPIDYNPAEETVLCPFKDDYKIRFLSSNVDCRRYYICYHGRAQRLDCIDELHWNPVVERCDLPERAKCKIIPPIVPLPKCPKNGKTFFPHPSECDYFIFCQNGFSTVQQCPFYHHWDVGSRTCKWRVFTHCESSESKH